jgi:hypothetical protein
VSETSEVEPKKSTVTEVWDAYEAHIIVNTNV